jgi:hypothetical protein
MIKTIQTLVLIRLRKFLPPGDKLALILFFCGYILCFVCINEKFEVLRNYSLVFSLDIFFYHINRKDIELIKLSRKWKLVLLGEYFVYSFPYLVLFLLNSEYLLALLFFILTTACITIPQVNGKTIKYPFRLFDPFWHICWRKNKLLLFYPFIIFLVVIGDLHNNENLIIASFFLASIFTVLPSFQREVYESIKMSTYIGKHYLQKQFKTAIFNSLIITIPLIVTLFLFQKWQLLFFTPLIFAFPLVNILFKYSFFSNQFLHQVMFVVFLSTLPLGIPIIAIPFLYLKSIKTIKAIQYVSD